MNCSHVQPIFYAFSNETFPAFHPLAFPYFFQALLILILLGIWIFLGGNDEEKNSLMQQKCFFGTS